MDVDELTLLDELILQLDGGHQVERRYLFSRRGFTAQLAARAGRDPAIALVTLEEIYR